MPGCIQQQIPQPIPLPTQQNTSFPGLSSGFSTFYTLGDSVTVVKVLNVSTITTTESIIYLTTNTKSFLIDEMTYCCENSTLGLKFKIDGPDIFANDDDILSKKQFLESTMIFFMKFIFCKATQCLIICGFDEAKIEYTLCLRKITGNQIKYSIKKQSLLDSENPTKIGENIKEITSIGQLISI